MATIIYTLTDEAPLLATYSFLPVVQAFASAAGVEVETRDISLAGRIVAAVRRPAARATRRISDALAELGELATTPEANIIKLPNISASVPQLKAAVAELQSQGFARARLPRRAVDDRRGPRRPRPLRQGQGQRGQPRAARGQLRPPRAGGGEELRPQAPPLDGRLVGRLAGPTSPRWAPTTSATTSSRSSSPRDDTLTIRLVASRRRRHHRPQVTALPVLEGEVVDATVLRAAALDAFLAAQIARAKADDVLFSVHLKATMMKVSDPIIFGHVVRAYFADVFDTYGEELAAAGLDGSNGLGAILDGLADLEHGAEIRAAIEQGLADGPKLAMVNSDKGITNLHVPSDVIVDASMPAMIRTSGHMWGPDGAEADTLAVIPDSSYAPIYQAVIDDCRAHGAFDPTTMGSVPERRADGPEGRGVRQPRQDLRDRPRPAPSRSSTPPATVLLAHDVAARRHLARLPDQGRPDPRLGQAGRHPRPGLAARPPCSGSTSSRAHDRNLIAKVDDLPAGPRHRGPRHRSPRPRSTPPTFSVERIRKGEDTISVTGNVLRDYNTDLFPILELGTSAKMLSVVPLMNGGGLFETGAGGSAPKHVQQLVQENYLRWDSLGEFLALAESFRHVAETTGNARAGDARRGPRPRDRAAAQREQVPEPAGSARSTTAAATSGSRSLWAQELAEQTEDAELAAAFAPVAEALRPTRRRSTRSSSPCRASRSTSAATTGPTPRRPRP